MRDRQLTEMARLFKALADETRLRILGLLMTGEVCVCHIHETLAVPQSKASRHLAYLRRTGLVTTRRDGLWVYYRLAGSDDAVTGAIEMTLRHVLGHVPQVRRDAERLRSRTGCCLPAAPQLAALPCCATS